MFYHIILQKKTEKIPNNFPPGAGSTLNDDKGKHRVKRVELYVNILRQLVRILITFEQLILVILFGKRG
jgi:hypothetical protein